MIQPALIKKQRCLFFLFAILTLVTSVISMSWGPSSLTFDRLFPVLFGHGTFSEEFVLFSLRLPRIIITILAGMALALSGCILQGITRNDLADPGIMGINSGAGLAVAIFFLFFPIEAGSFIYMLPLAALIGALLTAALIYLFSHDKHKGLQPIRLVLVGIGVSLALSGAMIVLISSAEREKVDFIAKWLAGNIWGADWPFIWALLPWLAILIPFTLYKSYRLDLLSLSEISAIGIGVSINRERIVLLVTAVALAASAVSVTGGISFVGLIAPHMAKALVGPRNKLFIPIAILIGGWFLLFADSLARNLVEPNGMPVGIMAALIGAPYFMYLLFRKQPG
ncbi:FecCD family ABC transporter permease [Peribacillus sp. SCS-26]|uniref:FecCD family ABC transporter permease n=1 Tax=Paraperibacillus marinus TaxID=3115295 RepID=UPI003906D2E8